MNIPPKLRAEILNRPTLTILKSASSKGESQFKSVQKTFTPSIPLPDEFDGSKVWESFLTPAKNQAKCGSCWAFATTACLADRFNIQSQGKLHINLSPAQMILCNFQGAEFSIKHPETDIEGEDALNITAIKEGACQGNSLFDAWRYLTIIGTCLDSCIPYKGTLGTAFSFNSISDYEKDNMLPLCYSVAGRVMDMCADVEYNAFTGVESGTPARFFRSFRFYSLPNDERAIMEEIYKYGPVTTGMDVYSSFYMFDPKREVYEHNEAETNIVGGHALEIVGWGVKFGKPCWIIKNSWGDSWGNNGYFYMKRGGNNCKIEENVFAGVPDFFYPADFDLKIHISENDETEEIKALRKSINTDTSMSAGGINPRTGYTRRVEITKPWIDTTPPIEYTSLPDWGNFVAGKVSGENKEGRSWKFYFLFLVLILVGILVWRKWKVE